MNNKRYEKPSITVVGLSAQESMLTLSKVQSISTESGIGISYGGGGSKEGQDEARAPRLLDLTYENVEYIEEEE